MTLKALLQGDSNAIPGRPHNWFNTGLIALVGSMTATAGSFAEAVMLSLAVFTVLAGSVKSYAEPASGGE